MEHETLGQDKKKTCILSCEGCRPENCKSIYVKE